MPSKQPLFVERPCVVLRRIKHHFDHPFDITVSGGERADLDAEPASERGADLVRVELLAFDFAGFEDIFGERAQDRFAPQGNPERFHASDQLALAQPEARQLLGDEPLVPTERRPVVLLMEVHYSARFLSRL